jgi:DNA polymerase-3 subunit gamma/tau
MSRQSLAVKWRPQILDEVVGQQLTVHILKRAIETKNFKHCYLFAGDSGCGKTTVARCFAKAINQGVGEPIEIDAASFSGVDNVRAIIEASNQRALDSEYKIFIIDECHAISQQGWNAYLKAIEEPFPYTIYIFCTTEPNKLPEAILNRMQRYNITKPSTEEIRQRLLTICKSENYINYEAACDLISKTSHGCLRDAIMKLEQCTDFSIDLCLTNVKQVLNTTSFEAMFYLVWALQDKNEAQLLKVIDRLSTTGVDLKSFIDLFLEFVLDLAKFKLFNDIKLTNIPEHYVSNIQSTTEPSQITWFNELVDLLLKIKLEIRYDSTYKSTIEAFLLKFCR